MRESDVLLRDTRGYSGDLRIEVKDHVIDTDRVTSWFVVTGRCYGREVSFESITISRFEGELIVEDWTVTDVWGMLERLRTWRTVLIALKTRVYASATVRLD